METSNFSLSESFGSLGIAGNAARYCGHEPTIIIEGATMQVPIEQLLNLPDIQVVNVEITEREIKCDIESTRGYSICHRCG